MLNLTEYALSLIKVVEVKFILICCVNVSSLLYLRRPSRGPPVRMHYVSGIDYFVRLCIHESVHASRQRLSRLLAISF